MLICVARTRYGAEEDIPRVDERCEINSKSQTGTRKASYVCQNESGRNERSLRFVLEKEKKQSVLLSIICVYYINIPHSSVYMGHFICLSV